MADNRPTVFAYGMREVGNGKWEAFRVRVPLASIEALTPIHKTALKETRWHESRVPDPKQTDAEAPRTIAKRVLGEVASGKFETKRGEREDLALSRFHEAERSDRLKVRLEQTRARHRAEAEATKRAAS